MRAREGRAAAAGEPGPAAAAPPRTRRTAAAVRITFLGAADSKGSGMVRNALPVGAAGAQEV